VTGELAPSDRYVLHLVERDGEIVEKFIGLTQGEEIEGALS